MFPSEPSDASLPLLTLPPALIQSTWGGRLRNSERESLFLPVIHLEEERHGSGGESILHGNSIRRWSCSMTMFRSTTEQLGIEQGDVIRDGLVGAWTVECIQATPMVDFNFVIRSCDGRLSTMDPERVSQCQCGRYVLDARRCCDCVS